MLQLLSASVLARAGSSRCNCPSSWCQRTSANVQTRHAQYTKKPKQPGGQSENQTPQSHYKRSAAQTQKLDAPHIWNVLFNHASLCSTGARSEKLNNRNHNSIRAARKPSAPKDTCTSVAPKKELSEHHEDQVASPTVAKRPDGSPSILR